MASDELKTVGEDGIFKLLAWKSQAITRLFGLPDIDGDPVQQEFQFPTARRVDRLYKLVDGSLLNIEHQSSLNGRDALARRMCAYHLMIKEKFPLVTLLQIVVFTGRSADRREIGDALEYVSLDGSLTHGVRFSAALRDFRAMPPDEFRKTGLIDDLILGLMTRGGDDDAYIDAVVTHIQALDGEPKTSAVEKFIAVCATMTDRKVNQIDLGDLSMWVADAKDNYVVRQIIEIAGKDRIEAAAAEGEAKGEARGEARGEAKGEAKGIQLGIARIIVRHAIKQGIALPAAPARTEALLAANADPATLERMIDDIETMTDFNGFVEQHVRRGIIWTRS